VVRNGLSLAVALILVLAGCSNRDAPLPGERIPVRPEEAPIPGGARQGLGIPAPVMNASWSHRNGAARGRLVNPALRPVPQLIWTADIGVGDARRRRLISAPIVAGGLIFTMDASGQVTAVNRNGQIAWSRSVVPDGQVPDSGNGGGFAEEGGVLFVTSGFGEVLALNPGNGGTIWQRTVEAPIRAAPTVADGRVFVVQRNDTAYALDARGGQILWRVQGVGGPGLLGGASPAVDGQLAVLPFASGEVLGVLARNGLAVWGTAITGGRRDVARNSIVDVSGDPVIDGDVVYASNQAGRTISLDSRTGERNWTIEEGSYGPAWPVGGSLFLLSDQGALVRADAATGALLWRAKLPELFPNPGWFGRGKPFKAIGYHGPVLAGGRLWVAGADGLLRAFNPVDGALLAELPLPGGAAAGPVVAGGVMYIATQDGKLLAFQ